MGRPRLLPDAEPRICSECEITFTPGRKNWQQVYCSLTCQRKVSQRRATEAARNPEAIAKRRAAQLDRGEGKSYRKFYGRHEHRVVMEEKLGRPLVYGEIVHHINHDPRDNRPENLMLLNSQAEHPQHHQPYFGGKRYKRPKSNLMCSEDCDRAAIAKGLCGLHYMREKRRKRGAQP